jgi:2-succinyl-5-enolpyruvyl-6-hydroxy-3-cyclohexene-1-carboxylate synthase
VGAHPGPVHLNLPFREPLIGTASALPPVRLGPLITEAVAVRLGDLASAVQCDRGVIVAGRGVDDPAAVEALAESTGWPILADPRSGCRGLPHAIAAFDAILRHDGFAGSHVPDVVVHLGEPPASKVLAQWLATAGGVQVRVHPTRSVIDPAHRITHRVVAPVGDFCVSLARELRGAPESSWSRDWSRVDRRSREVFDAQLTQSGELSEPLVARVVSQFPGRVMVASSMPIRDLEWFGAPDQHALVSCNRGANGIDGTIASAIGIALATREPVAVLLGDVAFLHDATSLTALGARGADVRIVVVDNDGGGIFSFLPQADALSDERFEQLFGTPHGTDLVALAAAHGVPARTVENVDELRAALAEPGPTVVRVCSERAANVAVHRMLNESVVAAIG